MNQSIDAPLILIPFCESDIDSHIPYPDSPARQMNLQANTNDSQAIQVDLQTNASGSTEQYRYVCGQMLAKLQTIQVHFADKYERTRRQYRCIYGQMQADSRKRRCILPSSGNPLIL